MDYREYIKFARLHDSDGSTCIAANAEVLPNGTRWYKVYDPNGTEAPSSYDEYGELLWVVEPYSIIEVKEETEHLSKWEYYRIVGITATHVIAVSDGGIISI